MPVRPHRDRRILIKLVQDIAAAQESDRPKLLQAFEALPEDAQREILFLLHRRRSREAAEAAANPTPKPLRALSAREQQTFERILKDYDRFEEKRGRPPLNKELAGNPRKLASER